jgi:cation:H+ antiporter
VTAAASRLGVSVLALGLLLAGAEPEEAVTAMVASGQGHPALAAGDAVGANLVILTLTLGLAALLTRLPVGRAAVQYAVAAAVAGAVAWVLLLNGVLGRLEGLLLVLLYVGGVVWVWRRERQPPLIGELVELVELVGPTGLTGSGQGRRSDVPLADVPLADVPRSGAHPADAPRAAPPPDAPEGEDTATGRALGVVLLGVLAMVLGGALAVRGAEGLVDVLHLGESVVGLTVLALATSAEMVALVWAARRRGLSELVVAGAVGAVAYNATVTLGLSALVSPLLLGRHNVIITVAAVTAVLPLVLLVARRSGVLWRPVGAVLVVAYVGALGYLLAG